jgi:murein DD-endopeptidase MepM/ murein hydrolase activator NlpD
MEKHNNPLKNSRILYITVVAVLCVTAIIIGIVAATSRAKPTPDGGGTVTPPPSGSTQPPSEDQGNTENPPAEQKPAETKPSYLCPLSGVVNEKHDAETLVFSSTMGDWRIHTGIDIATSLGETVRDSADGTVKEVWEDVMMGTCVSLDHGNGVVTVYQNLDEALPETVAVGKTVKAGDAIGAVGESALAELAEEPHLHFEMLVNGEPVDPLSHLSEDSVSASLSFDEEILED